MKTNQSGASHLMLVLIISLLLLLLSLAIQSLVYLQTKQTTRNINSREAYFAAEGALFSTLQSIRDNPQDWIDKLPVNDTFYLGKSQILREVYQNEENEEIVFLKITADNKSSRRSLLGELSFTQSDITTSVPQDVLLVIDSSSSMNMNDVQTATLAFIDLHKTTNIGTRIGYVKSGGSSSSIEVREPTDDYDLLISEVEDVDPVEIDGDPSFLDKNNPSNFSTGIWKANAYLRTFGLEGRPHVIVVISDGIATATYPINVNGLCGGSTYCIDQYECFNPGSGYLPEDGGNCCTNNAIENANEAKADGTIIHSIYLVKGAPKPICAPEATDDYHGRLTMLHISSQDPLVFPDENTPTNDIFYYESVSSNFESVLINIGNKMGMPGYFQYKETVPSPD